MIQADIGTEDIAELFRVIGHPSRLAILLALVAGEHGVGALDQATGIGQPSLSQQLGVLRKAELVVTRRDSLCKKWISKIIPKTKSVFC